MRMPRVRITIRRMMVAVAIVGVSLGIFQWIMSQITWAEKPKAHQTAPSFVRMTGTGEL